jgi:hypothetical protein
MTLETGVILGTSALMAIALVAQALGLSGAFGRRMWRWLIIVTRVAAAAALAAALILVATSEGAWKPFDLRHLTLSLALAVLTIQLAIAWGCHTDGAGPAIDLVVLPLSLLAVGVRARESQPTCPQPEMLFLAQWGLFVVGAGGAVVAGSAGLMLLLRGFWAKIGWNRQLPPRDDVQAFLRQATTLTLAALGIGLVASSWLAWRNVGAPTGGDPRSTWMAITWLISAMSLLAWRLRQRPGRQGLWAAILDISAASTAIVGILAITGISRVLGT